MTMKQSLRMLSQRWYIVQSDSGETLAAYPVVTRDDDRRSETAAIADSLRLKAHVSVHFVNADS